MANETANQTVTVSVEHGPSVTVPWMRGMTAQQALEQAYVTIGDGKRFTYALQYFGRLGYLVVMINETWETFNGQAAPNFYWEFFLNDEPARTGIDGAILEPGTRVRFAYQPFLEEQHAETTVGAKHQAKLALGAP